MAKYKLFPVLLSTLVTLNNFNDFADASSIVTTFNLPKSNSVLDDSPRIKSSLIVDKNTGFVYAGANNWIFQLDSDLNLIASVANYPNDDCSHCRRNQLLFLNQDFQELLACTSVENSRSENFVNPTCTSRNLSNITEWKRNISTPITHLSHDNPFAFIAPGPSEVDNDTINVLYVAVASGSSPTNENNLPPFTSRSLSPDSNLNLMSTENLGYSTRPCWLPVYGFSYKGFSYFLTTGHANNKAISKLTRLCQGHSNFTSFAEISIECGPENSHGRSASAAYNRRPGTDLAEHLNINSQEDEVLIVIYNSIFGTTHPVCIYLLEAIRKTFHDNKPQCDSAGTSCMEMNITLSEHEFCQTDGNPILGSSPIQAEPAIFLNETAHALTATSNGASTVVFIGTETGHLKRFLLKNASGAFEYSKPIKFSPGAIKEVALDPSEEHLFVMSGGVKAQVSKLLLWNCSELATLRKCLDAQDPFCGWCKVLKKCTSRKACFEVPNSEPRDAKIWITCTTPQQFQTTAEPKLIDVAKLSLDVTVGHFPICYKRVVHRIALITGKKSQVINSKEASFVALEDGKIQSRATKVLRELLHFGVITSDTKSLNVSLSLTMKKNGPLLPNVVIQRTMVFYTCVSRSYYDCLVTPFPCVWNRTTRQCGSAISSGSDFSATFVDILENPTPQRLGRPYQLTCKIESDQLGTTWWTRNNTNLADIDLLDDGINKNVELGRENYDAQFNSLNFKSLELFHFGQYNCHYDDGNQQTSVTKIVSVDFSWHITLFYAEPTSSTSVKLTWQQPSANQDFEFYAIWYYKTQHSEAEPRIHVEVTHEPEYLLSGLEPSTMYVFQVQACLNEELCGNLSDQLNASTLDEPTNLTPYSAKDSTVLVLLQTTTSETVKALDGSLVFRCRPYDPVLLTCQVPAGFHPAKVILELEYTDSSTIERTKFQPNDSNRQMLAFPKPNKGLLKIQCHIENSNGTRSLQSLPTYLEVMSDEPKKPFTFKNFVDPDPTLLGWCKKIDNCSYRTPDTVFDSAINPFGFYGIRMNPPAIEIYNDKNLTEPSKLLELPATMSMRNVKHAVIRADPSEPQVIWTHSPRGHLWLTNVHTEASVVLKKRFDVVDMDVDWDHKLVFGVAENDQKCILKLDLTNTSSVTNIFFDEALTSIAVGHTQLYYITESGKIFSRGLKSGSKISVFESHYDPRPMSLIHNLGKISWLQHFFGTFSIIYTVQPQQSSLDQLPISRFATNRLIRGILHKPSPVASPASNCSKCSHFCNPFRPEASCGCQWKLFSNETKCSGTWIHAITDTVLATFDFENTTLVRQQTPWNSHQIKIIPHGGSGIKPCYLNETETATNLVCQNVTKNLPMTGFRAVLQVLKNPCSSDVDILFMNGSCIQMFVFVKNETWTLFCGEISSTNAMVDTKYWIAFWQNSRDNSVYMTDLDSLETRIFITAKNFQLETQVPGRLSLDSDSSILYWIHGSKIWSRSYKERKGGYSKPMLLWDAGPFKPQQLQFHNGFLYWIEPKTETCDQIVIFDIENEAKQTLIQASDGIISRFKSFAVQSDTLKPMPECSNCSHFYQFPHLNGPSSKCWCPWENPILASNGTCLKPTLYVVQENATSRTIGVIKTPEFRQQLPKISAEAPAGSTVFANSQNAQCWLTGPRNQIQCWSSKTNETKLVGFAHSTNPTFSMDYNKRLVVFNTGSEQDKYGSLTLANIVNGHNLTFQPIKQVQASPFAFDHRRKLAFWCNSRELRFHEVGGNHMDSREVNIETDRCVKNAKSCTSLTLDEENGRAYFIYGRLIRRLDYRSKNSAMIVTTIHETIYSYASSLSFDGNGHLFWIGGFSDFGGFVDMVKLPEATNVLVASIRVFNGGKNKIIQVQAGRRPLISTTKEDSEDPCDTSDCQHFCFPDNRWNSQLSKCYCPTGTPPGGDTSGRCEPLYKHTLNSSKEEETFRIIEIEHDDSLLKIIIGTCSGVVVLVLIIFGVVIRRRRGNQQEDYKKALALFLEGDQDSAKMIENPAERSYYVPFSKTIPPEDINLTDAKQLGSGQFGAVFLAEYKNEPAAIKIIKHGSDKEQMKEFLKEIKIMAYIGEHAHIVYMFGAEVSNLEKGGVLVVLELCPHGDLESYLRKKRDNYIETPDESTSDQNLLNFNNLAEWSCQIAHGLAYLEEKQVVHGDLATRNVLLFNNNVVKVSDFGFSRKTYGKQYTKSNKQTLLPFRSAAPETLDQMVFSSKSDVWSYGVTVWEIFTLGNCPFAQQSWDLTFSARIREGMRLEKPESCTDEIYDSLMMRCWQIIPDDRPTFGEICEFWKFPRETQIDAQ